MTVIPATHRDLLERPLFAHLATIRPDGIPQVNPMWFAWEGERLRFTSTTQRFKYRNMTKNPQVAVSINDPQQPYRYLEIRGTVEAIEPDEGASFFFTLANRYDLKFDSLEDAPYRVICVVKPTHATYQ